MSMRADTAPAVRPSDALGVLKGLLELTKPGVTRLVIVTTACGAFIAPGEASWLPVLVATLGTAVVVAAANVLNMYLERDVDQRMERTRTRPLPSGRVAPEVALWFGVVLALAGITALTFLSNPATGLVASVAFVSYVMLYTPLKRVTPFALHVGAVPGALPPVIGWAAMTGSVNVQALALFGILFVWQLPHFAAITIFRKDEYERAGLQVLAVARGTQSAKRFIVQYSTLMLLVSLVPVAVGLTGLVYLSIASACGAAFLGWGVYGLVRRDAGDRWAKSLFFASMPYLVVLFTALVVTAG